MKLRAVLVAAALGATVLTTVPAVLAPDAAYACDYQTSCEPEPEPEPEVPGDTGGDIDNWDTGSFDTDNGGIVNVDGGQIGDAPFFTLETVIVTGIAEPQVEFPAMPLTFGGAGGGAGVGAVVTARGELKERRGDCLRNEGTIPMTGSQTLGYTVSYQVNAGVSVSAAAALSASLGVTFGVETSRSSGVEVTIPPGGTFALYVQYQDVTYAVTTSYMGVLLTDPVTVSQPTGVVTGRSC